MRRKALPICLWTALAASANTNSPKARAQGLNVSRVTATPDSGGAGDVVSVSARIGNKGSRNSWEVVQFQWYVSEDETITTDGIVLGDVETLPELLYGGTEITITRSFTMPPFNDPSAPSYIGILLDPFGISFFDPDHSNNSGAVEFTYTSNEPAHSFFDPTGDNELLDIMQVQAQTAGGNLEVAITFAAPPPGIFFGLMAIDLDQNPATGGPNLSIPGVEAIAQIIRVEYTPIALSLLTAEGQHELNTASLNGNTFAFNIPLSLLRNDSPMDLFWAFGLEFNSDFDRAPDVGAFATDTDEIVVRQPGNAAVHVDVEDPTNSGTEPNFPDLSRLQMDVTGDQLEIVLSFVHPVDKFPSSFDGFSLSVSVDEDKRLCTGFENNEQSPATFGVDYALRILIDPLAGVVPELWQDENGDGIIEDDEKKALGLPLNDMFMRVIDNQVICRIPLRFLGFTNVKGAVAVTSLNTIVWESDVLPNTGAWDIETNQELPRQSCKTDSVIIRDPDNDSIGGFGLDNDELISLEACLGDATLLLTVDYKDYSLDGEGATLVYLDTDRNSDTGQQYADADDNTQLGVEYALMTWWEIDSLKQWTVLLKFGDQMVDFKNQFTVIFPHANRIYITIPLDCIGNPTDGVNLSLQTAAESGGMMLPYDWLPDQGVVTLATESTGNTKVPGTDATDPRDDSGSGTCSGTSKSCYEIGMFHRSSCLNTQGAPSGCTWDSDGFFGIGECVGAPNPCTYYHDDEDTCVQVMGCSFEGD